MAKAFISYTGHAKPDDELAAYFADYLAKRQHVIFIQTKIAPGESWPEVVDTKLKEADYLILVLSTEAARSDMVIEEVRRAVRLRQDNGHPILLPVRLGEVDMPYDLGAKVNRIQHLKWLADGDEEKIAVKLNEILSGEHAEQEEPEPNSPIATTLSADGAQTPSDKTGALPLPAFDASWLKSIDAEGGAVRLDSPFYIERPNDGTCKQRVVEKGHTLLISGPRQIGKSSLLARLYQKARDKQVRAVYLDFQILSNKELANLDTLLPSIANQIYDDLNLNNEPTTVWRANRTAGQNLTRYLQNEVIGTHLEPMVILMDEVDRIFKFPDYRDDFFALVRYWHTRRAVDPKLEWLNLVLAYSTEASLFIQNEHQSPFNVGEKFELLDFTRSQFEQLNLKHGKPVKNDNDLEKLMNLLGGHPFLVRHTLYELAVKKTSVADLISSAARDDGPFSGHLQYYMLRLQEPHGLRQPMKLVLQNGICPDDVSFFRLRSAGLVRGPDRTKAEPRCGLYAQYFGARL